MMGRSKKKNRKTLKEIRQKKQRRNERRKNNRHQMVPVNVTAVQRGGPVQELQDSSCNKLLKQWWNKVEEDFEEWVKQMKSQLKWLLIEANNDDGGSEIRISKKLRPDSASKALNCLDYGQFVEAFKNLQRKLSQLDDESEDDSGVVDVESAKNERNFELHSVDAKIDDSHSSSPKRSSTSGNEIDDVVSISSTADEGDHERAMEPSDSAKDDEIDVFARWEESGAAEINYQTNDPEPLEANVPQEDLSMLSSHTEPLHVSTSDNHLASITLGKRLFGASEEEDYLVARSAKNRKKNSIEPELLNEVNGTDSFLEKYYTSAKTDEGDGSEDDEVDNSHSSEDGLSVRSRVNEIGGKHLDEVGLIEELVFYTEDVTDEHTDELDSEDDADGLHLDYLERRRSSDEKHDRRTEDDDSRNDPFNVSDEDLPANKETSVKKELLIPVCEFDPKLESDTTAREASGPKKRKFDEDVDGDESGNHVESLTEICISPPSPGQTKTETYANLVRFVEKIKGFLNGLTESDMQNFATQMERLCSKHSQHDFYANLWKLLTDSFMSDVLSPERNVMQQTTSVTIHPANICPEEDYATVAGIRECTVRLPRLNLSQEVSSLLYASTVPNVGTPDDNYRVQISFTVRDPDTTRVQASSAQFSGDPTQQLVLLDSLSPTSATVAESVPSSVHDIPGHYTDFGAVPSVQPHELPYVYTVNWPCMGSRFRKEVFRSDKDRIRCRRCGWLGKARTSFSSHYYSRCAKAEDKTNVSIFKEAYFVATTPPKPGEAQYFSDFRDLPLVRDSEPPYDYICSSYCNLRIMNNIFRIRSDFVICCKCKRSYQNFFSFNGHWSNSKCRKECNETRGVTKRIHVL